MTPSSTASPPTMISLFWLISDNPPPLRKPGLLQISWTSSLQNTTPTTGRRIVQGGTPAVPRPARARCGLRLYQLPIKIHGSGAGFFLLPVFLLESFNATRGVDQLLFAGEKRMAVRTDFDMDLFLRRTGRPGGAASADHLTF